MGTVRRMISPSWLPRRVVPLVASVLLVLGACGDDADPAASSGAARSAESSTTTAVDAEPTIDTATLGPHQVGRRTVTVVDPSREDRELTVDVWYPTDVTDGDASTYSFAPGIEYDSDVALDGPPVSSEGPFPLVVYSHGSGGLRYVASYFTETLASHGFVVVAPDHAGNTTLDQFLGTSDPMETIARNRPLDVSVVISAVVDGAVLGDISEAVDPEEIAVTGHSFGGFTALAVGGGFGDISADPRVSAVVAMAPAAGLLSDADLAAVDVPTLVLSGTLDGTTPIDPNTVRTASLVSGRPLIRVDLIGATHQSFTDVCDYTVLLRTLPDVSADIVALVDEQAGTTCDPDVLDVEEAQDLVNRYTVAFLLQELSGSEAAAAVLDPDSAPDTVAIEVAE